MTAPAPRSPARRLLRQMVRIYAEAGQPLPSTLVLARSIGVTSWTVQHTLGEMHDRGEIILRGAGRRRIVEFKDGKSTT